MNKTVISSNTEDEIELESQIDLTAVLVARAAADVCLAASKILRRLARDLATGEISKSDG